jgi:copper chaperone NosL
VRPRRRAVRIVATLLGALLLAGCRSQPPRPVAIDTRNDQCASCRMVISDPRFAAQVIAPGEEPRLYDDLRCLRDGLAAAPPVPGARIFVADRRTGDWVAAGEAIYLKVPGAATPMASQWVAYASEASRRADPQAREGTTLPAAEVFGTAAGREGTAP